MAELKELKKIQDLLNKFITKMEETETKEPKAAKAPKAPKEPKEKAETPEKNVPRMTPTISKKLQEVVEEVTTWDDKMKKQFAEYANSMTKDDYATKKLEEHIEDFALTLCPKAAQGGGGAEPAPSKEKVEELTYKELKDLKNLKETNDPLVFSTKKGLVTGPAEVSDEDMEEGLFKGAEILIGEKTRRVYNSEEEFMGWWGIGKFKEADM